MLGENIESGRKAEKQRTIDQARGTWIRNVWALVSSSVFGIAHFGIKRMTMDNRKGERMERARERERERKEAEVIW